MTSLHSELLDLPIKWTHIRMGLRYTHDMMNAFFPCIHYLIRFGIKPVENDNLSVLIRPNSSDMTDIQYWLKDNAENNFSLYGRFDHNVCHGVNIRFYNEKIALRARMTF